MSAVQQLDGVVPVTMACDLVGLSRRAFYRHIRPQAHQRSTKPRPRPARGLSEAERQAVLDLLHGVRFRDATPREIYATLLEEGEYHGHWRTFYVTPVSYPAARASRWCDGRT